VHQGPNQIGADRPSRAVRPRLAATLVLVDHSIGAPRLLMGRRSAAHRFMPGKWVFPGGRVARQDYGAACASELDREVMQALVEQVGARRGRALALAAIRETFEETGVRLSRPTDRPQRRGAWSAFGRHSEAPDLGGLAFIARLVTPPHRPQRFDTCFFLAHVDAPATALGSLSGELEEVSWIALTDVGGLETVLPTRLVLDQVRARLADDAAPLLVHRFRTRRN